MESNPKNGRDNKKTLENARIEFIVREFPDIHINKKIAEGGFFSCI